MQRLAPRSSHVPLLALFSRQGAGKASHRPHLRCAADDTQAAWHLGITKLNEAMNRALANPRVQDAFAKLGAEPGGGAPSEFGNPLKTQIAQWEQVVKESGIKMPQ